MAGHEGKHNACRAKMRGCVSGYTPHALDAESCHSIFKTQEQNMIVHFFQEECMNF